MSIKNPEELLEAERALSLTRDKLPEMLPNITPDIEPKKEPLLLIVLKKIPLFTGFLNAVFSPPEILDKMADVTHTMTQGMQHASKGLHAAGIGLDGLNFFLIPLTYLVSFLVGEKVPFTLSNNAKWAYAGVLLALALAAFLVPAVAGPLIGTAVFLGLVVSAFTFGKLLADRRTHKIEIIRLEQEIAVKMAELQNIVAECKEAKLMDDLTLDEANKLLEEYKIKEKEIQALVNEQNNHVTKLKSKDGTKMMDLGVGLALAGLASLGVILAFAVPVVPLLGLVIIGGSASAGLIYMFGRILIPQLSNLKNAVVGFFTKENTSVVDSGVIQTMTSEKVPLIDYLSEGPASHATPNVLSSEGSMHYLLGIDSSNHAAQDKRHVTDKFLARIQSAIDHEDKSAMLGTFVAMVPFAERFNILGDEAKEILETSIPDWKVKGLGLLQQALQDPTATSPEIIDTLQKSEAFKDFLQEEHVVIVSSSTMPNPVMSPKASQSASVGTSLSDNASLIPGAEQKDEDDSDGQRKEPVLH